MYIEHLRIPVGAGALHVERLGRGGRPIVLLHGFGTCAFLWRRIAPLLAERGFTVLAFDLLGYGESDRPPDAGYGLQAQADYLDLALTALRLPPAVVVGQDIGALVALELATRGGGRVHSLVLVSPSNPLDLPGPPIRALQRAAARVALGANSLFGAGPLLTTLLRDAVVDTAHMTDLLVARYLAPFVGGDGVSHLLMLASSLELEDDEALVLSTVSQAALIVTGAADRLPETEFIARLVGELGNQAGVLTRVVDGAGPLVAEDAPAALADIVAEWANLSAPLGV
jgi:pimeloyl-ACP methyl ester carboxylesterase